MEIGLFIIIVLLLLIYREVSRPRREAKRRMKAERKIAAKLHRELYGSPPRRFVLSNRTIAILELITFTILMSLAYAVLRWWIYDYHPSYRAIAAVFAAYFLFIAIADWRGTRAWLYDLKRFCSRALNLLAASLGKGRRH